MKYRNSEGYADPTAELALEHIAYEERQKRRQAKKKQYEAAKRKEAAIRRESRCIQKDYISKKPINWVYAWPPIDSSSKHTDGGK